MHLEIAKYFEHFYSLVIKPKLFDSLVDSEWNYFLSMFKGQSLQKDRLDLYFNIIENQRKIKPEAKPLQPISSNKTNLDSARVEEGQKQFTPIKQIQLTSQQLSRGLENIPPQRTLSCRQETNGLSLPKRYSDNNGPLCPSPSISPSPTPSPSQLVEGNRVKSQSKQTGSQILRLAEIMKRLVVTYQQTHQQLCKG